MAGQLKRQSTNRASSQTSNTTLGWWVGIGTGFMVSLVAVLLLLKLPLVVVGWYGAVSLATFLLYAHDKKSAKTGNWRVAEATLHKLALAGGWVGASFAHYFLCHKSQKAMFRKHFYLTVLGNIVGLLIVWWVKFR